jgi:phage shock protein C
VCGGIAEYAGVDATVIRVGVVLASVFTGGTVALAYLLAAILIPEE